MSGSAVAPHPSRGSRGRVAPDPRPGPPQRPVQDAAPGELRELRRGGCRVFATPDLCDEAERLGLLEPDGLARLLAGAEPGPRGRAATARVALEGARALLFRPLRRGGALARVWGDRWIGIARPLAELRAAARLLRAGAPVARPALVAGERRRGLWRAAVATWHEPRTLDARAFLAGAPDPARVARAASAAGAALRRFHDAGGRHRDLHAGNLILREDAAGAAVLLVDLDRARCGRPPGASARFAEMMRLYRSLAKRGLAAAVGRRGCAAFLRAYTAGDRGLRAALLRRLPRERRLLALHRYGWSARSWRGPCGENLKIRNL
jgi:3-deoxy-D-manno-octulosonic acid kinase